jgi:Fe-S cluster biogenesis protein NfuA
MAAGHNGHGAPAQTAAQAAGERVETLLAELGEHAEPQVAETAEELVSCLVELYGAGLAQIAQIIAKDAEAGPRLMDAMVADPLVESLLLLHDLHPLELGDRVRRSVDEVLPQLGTSAGKVEFLGVDEAGVIRLRLERGSGHGCGSAPAEDVVAAVQDAAMAAAPEAAGVQTEVVEAPAELPLLQIMTRPGMGSSR